MAPKTRTVKASPKKEEGTPPPKATRKAEKKAKTVAITPSNKRIGVTIGIALLVAVSIYTLSLPKTETSEWEIPSHFWYNEMTQESQWEEPVYEFQTDDGQTYWWDPEAKETFWEQPDSLQWEHRTDDEGNGYYFNKVTAEMQNETPAALAWVKVPYSKEEYGDQVGSASETAAEL